MKKYSALFLDRDGVLNDCNWGTYICRWEDFVWIDGVTEALEILTTYFDRIVVVTNQQCVFKNMISEQDLNKIHENMIAKHRIIDKVYAATESRYAPTRRKPLPTMAYEAQKDFPEIDFQRSWMVGDTDTDLEFGYNAGLRCAWIQSRHNHSSEEYDTLERLAQARFPDLWSFAKFIDSM
jgi:histidinol-phosphate phosphatase family protein